MRNFIKVLYLFLAMCFLLTGCNRESIENDTEMISVSVSNWPSAENKASVKLYKEHQRKMKELYPNITIIPDEWQYDVNAFLPKAANGQLPTVFLTYFTETQKVIDGGYAKDITEEVKKAGYDKLYNDVYMNLLKKDDRYFGLVKSGYIMGLLCNVKLFKEAGLVDENGIPLFPETFDDMVEVAKTIKAKTGKAGFYMPTTNNQGGWIFCNIAWAFGAEFEKQVNGKWVVAFDSDECYNALKFVSDLKWKHDVIQDDILGDASNGFLNMYANNEVAMGIQAPLTVNNVIKENKMNKDNVAVSRIPEGPVMRASLLGGGVYMFSSAATEKEVDAAFKWLEVTGGIPTNSEDSKNAWASAAKALSDEGGIVGYGTIDIFADKKLQQIKMEAEEPYITVTPEKYADYHSMEGVTVKSEPAVCAQELYAVFDRILQKILTDKNADIRGILSSEAEKFQTKYLDKH